MKGSMYEIGNILFLVCPEKLWAADDDLSRWKDILSRSIHEEIRHDNIVLLSCDTRNMFGNYKIMGRSVGHSEGSFRLDTDNTEFVVRHFIKQHKELNVYGLEPIFLSTIMLLLPVKEKLKAYFFNDKV